MQSQSKLSYPKCEGIEVVRKCPGTPKGTIPSLSSENKKVLRFFNKIAIWLFDGFGGYDITAVKVGFDIYEIPRKLRPLLMDRITIIVETYSKIKKKEQEKKKVNNGR